MAELAEICASRGEALVTAYLRYKQHTCSQTFEHAEMFTEAAARRVEDAWPEFRDEVDLLLLPAFFGDKPLDRQTSEIAARSEGERWLAQYRDDLHYVETRRQHHIHPPDAAGVRRPLAHCRRKDDPTKCKGGFPREGEVCAIPCVICPGLAADFGLPSAGRRNALGMLHGPRGSPTKNGTMRALSSAGRDNSDVQINHRLPIMACSHSSLCKASCPEDANNSLVAMAVQTSQDAQTGYSTDYANKAQCRATHECKQFSIGHSRLSAKIAGESVPYIGRRHAQRIISDCYLRGTTRGSVETENLNMYATSKNSCAAEQMTSFTHDSFPGASFLGVVEQAVSGRKVVPGKSLLTVVLKDPELVVLKHMGFLYGHRGCDSRVHFLSPYEFVRLL